MGEPEPNEPRGEDFIDANRIVCPNCMTLNRESAHLCRACLTPLSAHAAIDPMLSIGARVDTFSKASSKPRSPIVLLGMWLIFGPAALTFCTFTVIALYYLFQNPSFLGLLSLIPLGLFDFISVGLLYKTTANFIRASPEDAKGFPVVEDNEPLDDDGPDNDDLPPSHPS